MKNIQSIDICYQCYLEWFIVSHLMWANYIQSPCLYRISKLKNINIISNRFGIWPEINVKLLRSNIIYAELPIIFKNKSIIDRTVSFKNFIEITFNYLKLINEIFINNKSKYKNVAKKKYLWF